VRVPPQERQVTCAHDQVDHFVERMTHVSASGRAR
jgi:hypothetical protein